MPQKHAFARLLFAKLAVGLRHQPMNQSQVTSKISGGRNRKFCTMPKQNHVCAILLANLAAPMLLKVCWMPTELVSAETYVTWRVLGVIFECCSAGNFCVQVTWTQNLTAEQYHSVILLDKEDDRLLSECDVTFSLWSFGMESQGRYNLHYNIYSQITKMQVNL